MLKENRDKELNIYKRIRPVDKVGVEPCYELVVLLRSDISHEDAVSLVAKVRGRISEGGGVVKNSSYWGLRSLRYKIKRMRKAHFYCLQFTSGPSVCVDIERFLRNNSNILRFINLRILSFPQGKSAILIDLEKDISEGTVVYDEKYIVSNKG